MIVIYKFYPATLFQDRESIPEALASLMPRSLARIIIKFISLKVAFTFIGMYADQV
jgi:hypothetical protein